MKTEKIIISQEGNKIIFRNSEARDLKMIANKEVLERSLEKFPQRIFIKGGCIEFSSWFQAAAFYFFDPFDLTPVPIFIQINELIKVLYEQFNLWKNEIALNDLIADLDVLIQKQVGTCYRNRGIGVEEVKVKGISAIPPLHLDFPWQVKKPALWKAKVIPVDPQCSDNGGYYIVPLDKFLASAKVAEKISHYLGSVERSNPQPISP